MDPEYVRQCQTAFGAAPEKPYLELFIPERFRTAGWFSETLPAVRDRISQVAFARVDCDLYSSTVDVFDFLSDRLVNGAIVYFDDWTHEAGTGESKAFFEFAERNSDKYAFERLLTVSDGAMAVRVRKRLAVTRR